MADRKKSSREAGLDRRRRMFGPAGAEGALERASEFKRPLEEIVTDFCFGEIWERPGLGDKMRSLLTIAVLTTMGRSPQLKNHIIGAKANGASADEIREVILHVMVYAGVPLGVEAMRVAEETLAELSKS
jgi:4-carboxymuconolactone decarboxylase